MEEQINKYKELASSIINDNKDIDKINEELYDFTIQIDNAELKVDTRKIIAGYVLKVLTVDQRKTLCKALITEQIVRQREELSHWSTLTAQSEMIDTGYIAQHLVSLCTQISGQGMRGKGLDLADGSEVKSANFLDSKDRKGASNPRWNFLAATESKLKDFLHYTLIYLVSIDYNSTCNYRVRIWEVDVRRHTSLRKRYTEWMNNPQRKSLNFQLFPPESGEDSIYARHGSRTKGQLPPVKIALENVNGARKIFHAEVIDNQVEITTFAQ